MYLLYLYGRRYYIIIFDKECLFNYRLYCDGEWSLPCQDQTLNCSLLISTLLCSFRQLLHPTPGKHLILKLSLAWIYGNGCLLNICNVLLTCLQWTLAWIFAILSSGQAAGVSGELLLWWCTGQHRQTAAIITALTANLRLYNWKLNNIDRIKLF